MNSELNEMQIGTNRKVLKQTSPTNLSDSFSAPVLLIHGTDDRVVDVKHSRRMHNALTKADKPVEYVELEDGTHSLHIEENRIAALRAMEQFLATHLQDNGSDSQ